ncbi:MAG: hypothetical protein ACKVW3_11210 [Phycisphaerales bacterium]
MRSLLPAAVAPLLLAAAANAAIVGTTGMATYLSTPPPSALPGALTGLTLYCWDEAVNAPTGGVLMQMSVNPSTVLNNIGATPAPAPAFVNSHFLHLEGPVPAMVLGTITFDAPILGVIYDDVPLDITDGPLGNASTFYPTSFPQRGWNGFRMISINGPVLTFELQPGINNGGPLEQLRVVTAVPAPGPVALAGLGSLLMLRRRRAKAE